MKAQSGNTVWDAPNSEGLYTWRLWYKVIKILKVLQRDRDGRQPHGKMLIITNCAVHLV